VGASLYFYVMNIDPRKMNQEHYISLLIQQLSGALDEAQTAELNKWLAQNEENRSVRQKLIDSWSKAEYYKTDITIDESSAWKNITSNLDSQATVEELKPRIKSTPLWKKPLMIAASLAVVLACSWLLLIPENNQAIQYATNENETLDINLPDGSIVNLNESSRLTFLETKEKRIATLNGEALFEVTHDKSHPFTVVSRHTTTTVLGTIFNVNARDKDAVAVSLFEGKVSFEARDQSAIVLNPGEMVSYEPTINKIVKTVLYNENAMAWKTKELKFQNDNLEQVVSTLEKYFDKSIELVLDDESCQFTGTFKNPDYKEVIEVLNYTFDMKHETDIKSDKISILGCK